MGDTHADFTRIYQNEGMPDETSISLPNPVAGQVSDFKEAFIRSQPGAFSLSSWMLNESINKLTVFFTLVGYDKKPYSIEVDFSQNDTEIAVYYGSGNDRVTCEHKKVDSNASVWDALIAAMEFSNVAEQV